VEEVFAYQRGSAGIEHKISRFHSKSGPVNVEIAEITGDFNPM